MHKTLRKEVGKSVLPVLKATQKDFKFCTINANIINL